MGLPYTEVWMVSREHLEYHIATFKDRKSARAYAEMYMANEAARGPSGITYVLKSFDAP